MIDINNFYSKEVWNKVLDKVKTIETPCQLIVLDIIKQKYKELKDNLSYAKIYYAIKANPHEEIIKSLNRLGSNFDIASKYELDKVLDLGILPEQISYGNTIKKAKDIEYFYNKGIRLFVTDSFSDLANIVKYAPKSKVFCRILVDELASSDWPLSKKFGCDLDMAYYILKEARDKELIPYGVSFHVGSQQRDISTWHGALLKVKYLFDSLKNDENIELKLINMGGGFPAHYIEDIQSIELYCNTIDYYLHDVFGDIIPEIIIEPGRSLVGDSGVLVTEIINIAKKSMVSNDKWLFIDCGKFNGLAETLGESIKYPIYTERKGEEIPYIIAGKTCDSADILYEDNKYSLPDTLQQEDKVYFLSTGAYTASYSAINFNGFPPLNIEII